MALITGIEHREPARTSVHAPVSASAVVFESRGQTYLQLATYSSATRQGAGQANQIMQFGPEGILALRRLLASLPE